MLTADELEKLTRAKSQGAEDGSNRFPPATAANNSLSSTEEHILALSQQETANAAVRIAKRLEAAQSELTKLSAGQRKSATASPEALRARLGAILRQHVDQVRTASIREKQAARQLRRFCLNNKIEYELPYKSSAWSWIGPLILAISLESAANATLFGQASDGGLLEGFGKAFMISALNVLVGFATGLLPFRYMNHVKKAHLLWAFPLFTASIVMAFIFNMVVGHFREALALNPDTAVTEALSRAKSALFAITTFESVVLIVIGLLVFLYSIYKGYTVWSTYPGYRTVHLRHARALEDLDLERQAVSEELDDAVQAAIGDYAKLEGNLRKEEAHVAAIASALEGIEKELDATVLAQEIECNAAITIYRDANRTVRGPLEPLPRYFSEPVKLPRPSLPGDSSSVLFMARRLAEESRTAVQQFEQARHTLETQHAAVLDQLEEAIKRAEVEAERTIDREIELERQERTLSNSN